MIYAGTSGWAYPSWKPDFYPPKVASAKFLDHYASRLNAVEVNYTFRQHPKESTLTKWIAATPESFRFAVKANQVITHIKRLRDCGEAVQRFLNSVAPLASAKRLGPVLFQLPPFLKCDLELLRSFFAVLPRGEGCRFAMEFRHESWLTDEVFDALRRQNVALCIAEAEKLTVPDIATADFVYYRFRMGEYTPAERKELQERVATHADAGRDVFAFFKHEDSPAGAIYAEELLKQLAAD
jgi:uncharacterized protein YecE (DUF72 family)